MAEFGRLNWGAARIYFTGGVSALLQGWREVTVDIDLKAEPEPAGFFEILAAVTERTKAVFIANPNNPTGTYVPFSEVKRLHAALPPHVLLVLDATTGQNALGQIEVFKETAGVTGLVMTKLDGTARGGVLVAAAERYGLPMVAIGVGEGMGDLRPFDANEVARIIAGVEGGRR